MSSNAWLFWALASAGFASLTAIFAKMGLQGIDSDFATFIRTLVILAALVLFLTYTGKWQGVNGFTGRNWTFLILSGLATGASCSPTSKPCNWATPRKSHPSTNSAWSWSP